MRGEPDHLTPYRQQSTRLRQFRLALTADRDSEPDTDRHAARGTRVRTPPPGREGLGDAAPSAYHTPVERDEARDPDLQRAKRTPWLMRAVWRRKVGPAPTSGQDAAARYLNALLEVLDDHMDGRAPLTRHEARYLRSQIERWTMRAAGRDSRYVLLGTRPGRPRIR
jgi:hypothetical protein